MKISKKNALTLSISVIVLYWIYQLFAANQNIKLPDNFSEFAILIALKKSIHLIVIVLLLRIEGEKWQEMGLTFINWKRQILVGLLFGVIMFLFLNVGLSNILSNVFPKSESTGSILDYFKDPQNLYIWLLIGILGGGIVEELMRIFILTQFKKKFGQYGLYFALVFSSIIFGTGHLYQGVGIAISTGVSGLILGSIFIKRKSAIEIMTAHAFSDILAILGAYQLANHN